MEELLALLFVVLVGIAGYLLGLFIKNSRWANIFDLIKTKQELARTVVRAIEQMYKEFGGEEKLERALEMLSDWFERLGLSYTEEELRTLIEDAVKYFNDNFWKAENK